MVTIINTQGVTSNETVNISWRIINTDNYGGDYPNEKFVAIDIPSEEIAECFANAWNEKIGKDSPRYLRVVMHREIIYKGFKP